MKSNYNFIVRTFVLAVIISLLSACAIFKKNAIPAEEIKPESPEKIETSALLNLKGNFDEMNSFQAKTNVEVFFQGNNQEVKSQIRWVRDSVIWMNFSLFGIEGARLLINRDSFFLIDRINKKYMAEQLSQLATKQNLPVSFDNLQAILLGFPVLLSEERIIEDPKPEFVHFIQQDSTWRGDYFTSKDKRELTKMNLRQKKSKNSVTTELSEYKRIRSYGKFAHNRVIEFYSKQTGQAKLNIIFKDITINIPKEIKFSIPSSYEKM